MPQINPQKPRLAGLHDRSILQHVVRYGLTTNQVVSRAFFPGRHSSMAAKATARLSSLGYLERLPFLPPRNYFVPTATLAREYGLPPRRSFSLGPQSLPTQYALLCYAHLGNRRLIRLTATEAARSYPDLVSHWPTTVFCRDPADDQMPTEIVRVDLGGAPHHVARKCQRDIAGRMKSAAFRRRVDAGEFRLTILTTAKAKALAIAQSIDSRAWPKSLAFHLAVIPDLFLLTQGETHGP